MVSSTNLSKVQCPTITSKKGSQLLSLWRRARWFTIGTVTIYSDRSTEGKSLGADSFFPRLNLTVPENYSRKRI